MAGADILTLYPEASSKEPSVENPNREGAGDSLEAVEAAAAAHAEWLQFSAGPAIRGASPDERGKRGEVSAAFARSLGVESEVHDLLVLTRDRYTPLLTVLHRFDPTYVHITPHPVDAIDVGGLWWAETSWWTPSDRIGLYAYFDDAAGGVRFVGQQDYDDGDLWKGSAGARAIFGLGTDRMPPRGRYQSRPTTDLLGEVMGFTGVNGPLNWGDDWCKCWLHTDQTVRSASGAIIANAHAVQTLIFFEDDGSHGVTPLPGSLFFPPVAFDLDPRQALTVTLELKFDFQLEGSAMFRFGNYGGFVASLFRTPQWHLERA